MKDELIIKCRTCSEEMESFKGVMYCSHCETAKCPECGGELIYLNRLKICKSCLAVFSNCCYQKLEQTERIFNGEYISRCPECRKEYQHDRLMHSISVVEAGRNL